MNEFECMFIHIVYAESVYANNRPYQTRSLRSARNMVNQCREEGTPVTHEARRVAYADAWRPGDAVICYTGNMVSSAAVTTRYGADGLCIS